MTTTADEVYSYPKVLDEVILELFVHKSQMWLKFLGKRKGKQVDRGIGSVKRSLQDLLSKQASQGSVPNVLYKFLHDFELDIILEFLDSANKSAGIFAYAKIESDWVDILQKSVDVAKTAAEKSASTSFKNFVTKLEKVVHLVEGASEVCIYW